jgi:hypothetical protein
LAERVTECIFVFQGAVVCLTAKTSLFDPDQLDQIEGRMVGLSQKLNSIAEKKDVVEDCDKQTKVKITCFPCDFYLIA